MPRLLESLQIKIGNPLENEMMSIKDEQELVASCKPCPPSSSPKPVVIGSALPNSEKIQKFARTDPNWNVPFVTDEDNFPGWPLALGVALAAMLACWGLFHLLLWLGRV